MGMGNLQRMAMQMQQEMARVQAELETLTVEGSAGGGLPARARSTMMPSSITSLIPPNPSMTSWRETTRPTVSPGPCRTSRKNNPWR